ncbi:phage terminase large subunit [Sediminimonas qiaohouensis]|uniref:phage terminase large subunit n=1 Tax=Sediminimonas qiaohouensis TaxID=552061 RepID=UPI000402505A|nr:phage terminase large subunit [Sediminimonas qiaohouensis]
MTQFDPELVRKVRGAVVRQDLFSFVWKTFATLHPGQEDSFVPAWHVEAMCFELMNLLSGENTRLVVNVPPRHLKSITVAVAFVAYVLGHRPEAKIIVASYGLDLARKHSEDCRRVMEADWYKQAFPKTRLSRRGNTVDEFHTTQGGGRKAVSLGGAVTGHGADYIIIDDLLKAQDAASEAEIQRAQDFIEGTLLSRFNKPAEGRVVTIAQRLHELDPPGYLLDKGTYRHLNLPAIAEEDQTIPIGHGKFHHRKTGEALFPENMNIETLERLRKEMGPAAFNSQYQQNPVAPDGSPLRWDSFQTCDAPGNRSDYQLIVQSWDTGTSSDPRSDFSVCTTWGFKDRCWHLLDVFRDRLDFPELKRKAFELCDTWAADRVLIEDAATGRPLLQEFQRNEYRQCYPIKPNEDKEIRFNAACAPVEEGRIYLPREAAWLSAFKRELQSFPRGRYDDQVDSFSQFLNWTKSQGFYRALGRNHPINVERQQRSRRRPVRR